jgi:hypothetical protein
MNDTKFSFDVRISTPVCFRTVDIVLYTAMTESRQLLFKQVQDDIYVGNHASAEDMTFLANAGITAIINLGKRGAPPIESVIIFDASLPSQEMMDSEIPDAVIRLETLSSYIDDLRRGQHTILIRCTDGRNQSILLAGYYMITRCTRSQSVIEDLGMIYMTDQQRADEAAERLCIAENPGKFGSRFNDMSAEERVEAEARERSRKDARCLTMASFRKLLRDRLGIQKT